MMKSLGTTENINPVVAEAFERAASRSPPSSASWR